MSYANGQIPLTFLAPIAGGHLAKDAAGAWNQMNCEARKLGVELRPLGPVSSYRPFAVQQQFWTLYQRGGNIAAKPGTSNHGWGRAVDLCDGVNEFGTPTYVWMTQNAARFGWYHPSWAEPTGSKPEAWHWEFGG